MTQPSQVQSHPASVGAYIRHGWSLVPIPPGTKGPRTPGWNQRTAALQSQTDLPPGWGIGLAHAYSGTMALDIDDWHRAAAELTPHGIDLKVLYEAQDAVVIDSGKTGHGKLLYAMPFGMALPSKKIVRDGTTIYELRCATTNGVTVQDVLPPSIHPETGQPYRWAGSGNWTRLPMLPMPLLDLWQSMLQTEMPVSKVADNNASWSDVEGALAHCDSNCDRKQWVEIGMALHAMGAKTDDPDHAFTLWNEWSRQSPKYPGEREIAAQWRSFRDDKSVAVGIGTLFHAARQNGWTKPLPDVASLFSPTSLPTKPEEVVADIKVEPPNLDLNLFPRVLRERAMEISDHVGCDPLVPLWAGLAAVCGAVDARTRLELLPGFKVPPVLWIMTIGEPGDKKTPGSKPMFEIIRHIEEEDHPRFAKAVTDFEINEVRYTAAKKHLFDAAGSAEALLENSPLPVLPSAPIKPVPVRVIVQDITSQKLVRHAADRPQGMLCYLDEMQSWVRKICDPRTAEDKSAWTVAYESNRYEMDRVGTGTISVKNYALSIYGNIQPRVFRENIQGLSEDGLVQRFIPVPLRANQTRLGHPVPEYMTHSAEYDQMVRVAYGLPAMTYRLSDEAHVLYREFQTDYNRMMGDERIIRSGETFMTALGKLEGLCGRLALMFHIIENPYDTRVSADLMLRVIRLMYTYIVPVLRYVHDGESSAGKLDAWVRDYIVQYCDQDTITLVQIKRSARRQLEAMARHSSGEMAPWVSTQMIIAAMSVLEDSKWVARMDDGTQEHRGVVQWAINPLLKDTFKAHRVAVIEAKQRVVDAMYEKGPMFEKFKGVPKVKGYEVLQQQRGAR